MSLQMLNPEQTLPNTAKHFTCINSPQQHEEDSCTHYMGEETEAQRVTPFPGKQLLSSGYNCAPTTVTLTTKAYVLPSENTVHMI